MQYSRIQIGVIFYQRVEYVTTSTIAKTALLLAVRLGRLASVRVPGVWYYIKWEKANLSQR